MSDNSPPAERQGSCLGTGLAIIFILMAFGSSNQAKSRANHADRVARAAQNDVDRLESKVRRLEERIEALERR